jgi:hypothetical protein
MCERPSTMLRRIGTIIGFITALGVTLGGSQKSPGLTDHRVPAGTILQATLRTTVGSASSRVGVRTSPSEAVSATLAEPLIVYIPK